MDISRICASLTGTCSSADALMHAAAIGATSGSGLKAFAVTKSASQYVARANSCTLAVMGLYRGSESARPAWSRKRVLRDLDSSAYTGMSGLTHAIKTEGSPEPEPKSRTCDVDLASAEIRRPSVTESAMWNGRWL
eukprot:scaffold2866_cov148-Isochrysis_galbana.AAC.9